MPASLPRALLRSRAVARLTAGSRIRALRHDAFEAKLTSMAKHHVTRLYDVVVNLQPYRRFGE
jgi:hypothetical protein